MLRNADPAQTKESKKKTERERQRQKQGKQEEQIHHLKKFFFFLNVGREIKRYFIYSFKKKVRKFSENMQDKSKWRAIFKSLNFLKIIKISLEFYTPLKYLSSGGRDKATIVTLHFKW